MSNNKISEIRGLEKLVNLEELWLDENQITEIKGLKYLKKLEALLINNNPCTPSSYQNPFTSSGYPLCVRFP